MTYIYGIQSGQFIKVGAADDIGKRLRVFRLHNPHPLKVVLKKIIKENYWVENRMHRLLEQYAIGREWFECSPEQVKEAYETAFKEINASRHLIMGTARGWKPRPPVQLPKL